MNGQLAIVIIVDTEGALRDGTLTGNAYCLDNNRYRGSAHQGTDHLITHIDGQQTFNWLVAPADIFNSIGFPYITHVSGEAVDKGILVPQMFESPEFQSRGLWWGAAACAAVTGDYSYILTIGGFGTSMDLKCYFHARRGFSNYDNSLEVGAEPVLQAREFRSNAMQARN
jgi:hypothetical protein